MGTRALIGIMKNGDSKVGRCIYCHWDGYPDFVGAILIGHYKNVSKVEKLLALGSISILGEKVQPSAKFKDTHSLDTPAPFTTVAYYRDRDSKNSFRNSNEKDSAVVYNFRNPYCLNGQYIEWVYLFDPNKLMWHIYQVMDGGDNYQKIWLNECLFSYEHLIKEAVKEGYMTIPKK